MTRKEQILKLAEFNPNFYAMSVTGSGAAKENSRLKPLINAMADRIQQLERALGEVIADIESEGGLHSASEVLTTPNALDALLKGE